MSQRFRSRADVDDLFQTVQPGPFSEKQPQWLTLQLCLVTVGVTEWIECSRLNHLFYANFRRKLTPGSVLGPLRGRKGKKRQDALPMVWWPLRGGKERLHTWTELCKYKLAKPLPLTLQMKENTLSACSLDEEVGTYQ